jgi:hypothetical protein
MQQGFKTRKRRLPFPTKYTKQLFSPLLLLLRSKPTTTRCDLVGAQNERYQGEGLFSPPAPSLTVDIDTQHYLQQIGELFFFF